MKEICLIEEEAELIAGLPADVKVLMRCSATFDWRRVEPGLLSGCRIQLLLLGHHVFEGLISARIDPPLLTV